MRKIIFICGLLFLAYAIPIGALIVSSQYSIYPYLLRSAVDAPQEGVQIIQEPGFNAWFVPGERAGELAPIIAFTGNTGRPGDVLSKKGGLIKEGHDLLILLYPGSNGTAGAPSEAAIRSQALAAYDWLVKETGSTPIAYGLSLGTGVAAFVASKRDIQALVLEMPYTSIYDVARSQYRMIPPFDILPDNRWRSIDRIPEITAPTLILHGEQDQLIPVQHAFDLYQSSGAAVKELEIYPNGTHYNLHQFGAEERVFDFLKRLD